MTANVNMRNRVRPTKRVERGIDFAGHGRERGFVIAMLYFRNRY